MFSCREKFIPIPEARVCITPDADANRTYYGKPLTAKTILLSNWSVSIPESGVQFMETLNRFAPYIHD